MYILLRFLFGLFFLLPMASIAVTFEIIPDAPLPTTVPQYGKTSAFYHVKNMTNQSLTGNFVKVLPINVSQVTSDSKYCGSTFNLGVNGSSTESCILKLTIKGPVNASEPMLVCTADGLNCDPPVVKLSVTTGPPVPFSGIAVGSFSTTQGSGYFPLLAMTNNDGATWGYPTSIFENLNIKINSHFFAGLLGAGACSGSADKTVCIGAGYYCSNDSCSNIFPLIALGKNDLTTWTYPRQVFSRLTTTIDPDFTGGILSGASCSGSGGNNALCIASGVYFKLQVQYPLIAVTTNGGHDWSYPSSVFSNLKTAIDPSFEAGVLAGASCSQNTGNRICIGSGFYCPDANCNAQLPLVAMSINNGSTWTYPAAIFKNLNVSIDPNFQSGSLYYASCTSNDTNAMCTAAGSYNNGSTIYPLLAQTQDKGSTWTYPPAIFTNLETIIAHGFQGGFFNANSCSGGGNKAVCIAAGLFFTSSRQFPLLAVSRDGGSTWTYPDYIYTKLKIDVDPNLTSAIFDGASCMGTGNKAICAAAGSYCRRAGTNLCDNILPLLALSRDGGKTWSYPSQIFSHLETSIGSSFRDGLLTEVSCHGSSDYNMCIAAGQYTDQNFNIFPLLALSTDGGLTWIYPHEIYQNLTQIINPNFAFGSFFSTETGGGELKNLSKMNKPYVEKMMRSWR